MSKGISLVESIKVPIKSILNISSSYLSIDIISSTEEPIISGSVLMLLILNKVEMRAYRKALHHTISILN